MAAGDVTRSPCNSCARDTDHAVIAEETISEMEYPDSEAWVLERIVKCRGCGEVAVRRENMWRDLVPDYEESLSRVISVDYSPRRTWKRPPDWLKQIETLNADLHGLLVEVYSATNDDQVRLLAMGVRAALDVVMTQRVGVANGFRDSLDKMVDQGFLSKSQRQSLDTVIGAGSAAAHRGFMPSRELLIEMVAILEGLVRELYVTGPMMKTLQTRIPPKPRRVP